jgi:hypothetical protein
MDTTTCPDCGAPAEVTDRFALESTDGPIEHMRVQCVLRHWFLMPTASLARYRAAAVRPAVPVARPGDQVSSPGVPLRPRPARRWR